MSMADLQSEIEAVSSYVKLLEAAKDCRRLHEKAGLTLPPPLLRLLGVDTKSVSQQLSFPLESPDMDPSRNATRPPEAEEDWISIHAAEASPTTVTLAILRGQDKPVKAKDLADQVSRVLPLSVGGSVYNLLNRLEMDDAVAQTLDGWSLVRRDAAGVISGEYLWAPAYRLSKQDLATHRREAIVHLLRRERYLPVMEIVRKLLDWKWVKAPINKDLLKADMQVLEDKRLVKRIGDSRNWEVVS
jgi:hypothetical protein